MKKLAIMFLALALCMNLTPAAAFATDEQADEGVPVSVESTEPVEVAEAEVAEEAAGIEAVEDAEEPAQEEADPTGPEGASSSSPAGQGEDADSGSPSEPDEADAAKISAASSNEADGEKAKDADKPEPKPVAGTLDYADGDVSVSVSFGEDAGIVESAELRVSEITPSDGRYAGLSARAGEILSDGQSAETESVYSRIFDICIYVDGQEIEPKSAVQVDISFGDAPVLEKGDKAGIVHFADDGWTEVVASSTASEGESFNGASFTTSSFSLYAAEVERPATVRRVMRTGEYTDYINEDNNGSYDNGSTAYPYYTSELPDFTGDFSFSAGHWNLFYGGNGLPALKAKDEENDTWSGGYKPETDSEGNRLGGTFDRIAKSVVGEGYNGAQLTAGDKEAKRGSSAVITWDNADNGAELKQALLTIGYIANHHHRDDRMYVDNDNNTSGYIPSLYDPVYEFVLYAPNGATKTFTFDGNYTDTANNYASTSTAWRSHTFDATEFVKQNGTGTYTMVMTASLPNITEDSELAWDKWGEKSTPTIYNTAGLRDMGWCIYGVTEDTSQPLSVVAGLVAEKLVQGQDLEGRDTVVAEALLSKAFKAVGDAKVWVQMHGGEAASTTYNNDGTIQKQEDYDALELAVSDGKGGFTYKKIGTGGDYPIEGWVSNDVSRPNGNQTAPDGYTKYDSVFAFGLANIDFTDNPLINGVRKRMLSGGNDVFGSLMLLVQVQHADLPVVAVTKQLQLEDATVLPAEGASKEFTFKMTPVGNAPAPLKDGHDASEAKVRFEAGAVSGAIAQADFGSLSFGETGTYSYIISEEAANDEYWTCDAKELRVSVTVAFTADQEKLYCSAVTIGGTTTAFGENDTPVLDLSGQVWTNTYKAYKVTHEFVSGTPGKPLPQEVLDLVPADQIDKRTGDTVTPTGFSPKSVKVPDGTWSFTTWDADSKTVDGADVQFVGTWVFTPNTTKFPTKEVAADSAHGAGGAAVHVGDEVTYEITYQNWLDKTADVVVTDAIPAGTEFVSADNGGALADGVVRWTVPDVAADQRGSVRLTVRVTSDAVDQIANEANAAIGDNVPEWTPLVVNPITDTYIVTHEFVSGTPGKDLPAEVLKRVPADQTGKQSGDVVAPTDFDKSDVVVDGGRWVFVGWDADSKTIDGADAVFTGTWKFVPDETPAKPADPAKMPRTGDALPAALPIAGVAVIAGVAFLALGARRRDDR